ncbi:MAG: T9SS type A sorting domain-containing protein [Calditrichaeota bacterium]|nr:T9SS type A sorting domain-containing protein [Calditrichota bacterium]
MISAGRQFSSGLRNGKLLAWGYNILDRCITPFDPGPFISVSAGNHYGLALRDDGSVMAWGDSTYGAFDIPQPNEQFQSISAGGFHSLGLKTDGTLVCWGLNNYGQCNIPEPNQDFVDIAAGQYWSMALKADGSILIWGYDAYQSTGHGLCDGPEQNSDFIAIATGGGGAGVHEGEEFCAVAMGLKNDGSVVTWGRDVSLPEDNIGFTQIAAGGYFYMGLRPNGTIAVWGQTYPHSPVPEPASNSDFVSISAGYDHAIGLKQDGTFVIWGNTALAQSGPDTSNQDFVFHHASLDRTIGVKSDGTAWAWGKNSHGEMTPPTPNSNFVQALTGNGFSLYIDDAGTITGSGRNLDGELNIPAPNSGFRSLDTFFRNDYAGQDGGGNDLWITRNFVCGVKADGSIATWGYFSGDLAAPAPNTDFVSVKTGSMNCIALKSDGSVVVWGLDNTHGQLTVPEPNTGFIAVADGSGAFMALKSDGSIVSWGATTTDEVPLPNSGYVSIAAGGARCVGLRSDGTIEQWGVSPSSFNSVTLPVPNENFIAVDCESTRTTAIQRTPGTTAVQPFDGVARPADLRLISRYPNPFNPTVTLEYQLRTAQAVRLSVYNLAGERVLIQDLGLQTTGIHTVRWNGQDEAGRNVASGMYLLQLGGRTTDTTPQKCLLVR